MTSTAIRNPRAVRRFTLGQFLYDVGFWVEYSLVRIRRSVASAAGYAAESLENLLLLVLRPLVQGLLGLRQALAHPLQLLKLAVLTALCALFVMFVRTGLTLPFVLRVSVAGQEVGLIASEQEFDAAHSDVLARVQAAQALLQAAGQPTPDWDMEPSYTLTIAPPGSTVMNERQITNAILTASGGEITQATAVYLDDTLLYVTTEGNHLRSFLDNVKAAWRTPAGGTVGFVHDLQLVDGIYLTASVSGYKDVLAGLLASADTLQTKVVTHDTYTQPIDYETQTVPDDSLPFGQMVVVQEGQPGSRYVTYETTTVNGEVTDMQIIGISTVNDAVPQIVHEGTRLENGMIGKLGTGTFIWPVPNYRQISRWANLNRGSRGYHQGVDIAAPSGTPIYASDAGTVITAEYHHHPQSWGNYVVIDHGNGYKTLYAHMTNYVVQMGDTVEQGQLIGYVGSTGYSFGNHCHFEMYRDGTLFSAKEVFPDMPTWNPNFTK